jgi:hypothetical protein
LKRKLSESRVFALRGYTVKVENGKFYVAPTFDQSTYAGPYKSLQHATTAIARKLAKEFSDRNAKLDAFHGVDKRKNGSQRAVQ